MSSLPSPFSADLDLHQFIKKVGPCPLRIDGKLHADTPSLYESLIRAVTGQQLHTAAAEALFKRLCALSKSEPAQPPSPTLLLSFSEETLRGCGLSGAKVQTLLRIARAQHEGDLPSLEEATGWTDDAFIECLTHIKGIGRWTAEMLLLFTLHRPDVFPAHDLGVREGWRRLKRLEQRPTPTVLARATAAFSPHRSTLTWYCWEAKARLPNLTPLS